MGEDAMTNRCSKLAEVGRRQFLRGGLIGAAALPSLALGTTQVKSATTGSARLDLPSSKLGNVKDLKLNEPMDVSYPDENAPGVLLKLGKAVEGGVGPDGDIVGFTTVCPHKGYPLSYNAERRTMNCPGHYSVFDCEAGGQQTWGQATQNLPQYMLRVDDKGDIYAEGVDELLYGRLSNVI
jgi:arsenite oxidase small subunit